MGRNIGATTERLCGSKESLGYTDFGAELRCCVGYLENKVLVEGKKGNVVAKFF